MCLLFHRLARCRCRRRVGGRLLVLLVVLLRLHGSLLPQSVVVHRPQQRRDGAALGAQNVLRQRDPPLDARAALVVLRPALVGGGLFASVCRERRIHLGHLHLKQLEAAPELRVLLLPLVQLSPPLLFERNLSHEPQERGVLLGAQAPALLLLESDHRLHRLDLGVETGEQSALALDVVLHLL
eukprot:2915669-Prymnesium_polylepis.1